MAEALHAQDKRITSLEDWRATEQTARSDVRAEIFTKLHAHDQTLHGTGKEPGLVTTVALIAQTQQLIVWLLGLVVTGIFAAVGTLIWQAVSG